MIAVPLGYFEIFRCQQPGPFIRDQVRDCPCCPLKYELADLAVWLSNPILVGRFEYQALLMD